MASEATQQKIKDLETQYNSLNADLKEAVDRVHSNEHAIVTCLQTLMPLQNSYLTGIINTLQQQVNQLKIQQKQYQQMMDAPAEQRMPSNNQQQQSAHVNNIQQPSISIPNNVQTPSMPSPGGEAPPRRRRRNSSG